MCIVPVAGSRSTFRYTQYQNHSHPYSPTVPFNESTRVGCTCGVVYAMCGAGAVSYCRSSNRVPLPSAVLDYGVCGTAHESVVAKCLHDDRPLLPRVQRIGSETRVRTSVADSAAVPFDRCLDLHRSLT
jgi:hypothetical protein